MPDDSADEEDYEGNNLHKQSKQYNPFTETSSASVKQQARRTTLDEESEDITDHEDLG